MKYHNIPGIKKAVCTAEQKIAYNIAWRIHVSFPDKLLDAPQVVFTDYLMRYRDITFAEWERENNGKYNVDAVFCALNAGLEKYVKKPFIAWDYAEIGAAFPALYLEETARA